MSDTNAFLEVSDLKYPLPIEQRPMWRVSLLCIVIKVAGNKEGKIKLNKVRVFLWMLIRSQKWDEYFDSLSTKNGKALTLSSDKSTDKAIELAIAKNIVDLENDSVRLASQGYTLLALIGELQLLDNEIKFLESIKSKITDNYVRRILGN